MAKAAADKKTKTYTPPRPKGGHGKKYREKAALIEKRAYPIAEAAALLTQVSTATFDATAETHIRINADTTQADQLVRTTVDLPHGTGKSVRIAAFVPDDLINDAKKAGAHLAGNDDLIAQIDGGTIDFDIAVAVPSMMKSFGKVAKTLGQRGLMPSPKAGTVSDNIVKTIEALKKGRVECKMDKQGIIHVPFGKISFGAEKLQQNLEALLQAIKEAQPSGIKGIYILSVTVTPTMGPGVKVQI
ncbi:MAG: large subunit ribosomal protein L1 [Candidatus Peregrinibacteria bacterium Gr01-1014_25]|nr:MAG: large subunit ribosomal protein L1 [Candidatus Peregrinibacteria bacterium Gr01-1014_25]